MLIVVTATAFVAIEPLEVLSHFVHEHVDESVVELAPEGAVVHVENVDSPGHVSHHWHFWMVPGDSTAGPQVGRSSAATRLIVVEHGWGPTLPPFPPFSPPRA